MMTKDQIREQLGTEAAKFKIEPVKNEDGSILCYVRETNGLRSQSIQARFWKSDPLKPGFLHCDDMFGLSVAWIAASVCTEQGELIYEEADEAAIKGWTRTLIARIAEPARSINGEGAIKESVDTEIKN